MKKLRVGWAGLGPRGRDLIANALWVPETEIAAICDRDPAALASCRSWLARGGKGAGPVPYGDFASMLASDIDAVVIATEVSLHAPMAIQALDAGKHVLSEVPAITSIEDAARLRTAARRSGRTFMLGENVCYWAFIEEWRGMYREGRIGKAWYAEAEYLHDVAHLMRDAEGRPTWRSRLNAIQYLTHDLGPLLYIMDDRCVSVSGFAPTYNPIPEHSTGTPNEIGIFRTAKGALIKVLAAFGIQREPATHNFCLYGSEGTLETTRDGSYMTHAYFKAADGNVALQTIATGISHDDVPAELLQSHGGADYWMMRDFVVSVLAGTPPRVGIELAIDMSIPGIYAHRSQEQGGIPIDIATDASPPERSKA
jgi:predicted dehydrogenase